MISKLSDLMEDYQSRECAHEHAVKVLSIKKGFHEAQTYRLSRVILFK